MIDFIFESVALSMENNKNAESSPHPGDMPILRAVDRAYSRYVHPRPPRLGMRRVRTGACAAEGLVTRGTCPVFVRRGGQMGPVSIRGATGWACLVVHLRTHGPGVRGCGVGKPVLVVRAGLGGTGPVSRGTCPVFVPRGGHMGPVSIRGAADWACASGGAGGMAEAANAARRAGREVRPGVRVVRAARALQRHGVARCRRRGSRSG